MGSENEKSRGVHWMDGSVGVYVEFFYSVGVTGIWWYILRKPPFCSWSYDLFRIACYLLLSKAVACGRHCSRDKGDIIEKNNHEFKKPSNQ